MIFYFIILCCSVLFFVLHQHFLKVSFVEPSVLELISISPRSLTIIAGMQEGVKIAVTDNELRNQANQRKYQANSGDNDAAEACERLLRELPTPASLAVISIIICRRAN